MAGSVTVVGSNVNGGLIGIVTVPGGFSGAIPGLQAFLDVVSGEVTAGVATFANLDVAQVSGTVTVPAAGPGLPGILDISNSDSVSGSISSGTANISVTVPGGYSIVAVEAPGSESITGNGATNTLAIFGANSSVNYTASAGSGSVLASGNDNVLVSGTDYDVIGGTIGGNVFSVFSNTGAVTTQGGSNIVFVAGQNDSVVSGGNNDVIATDATAASVTVSGFANIIGTAGSTTVTAVGTGVINGFIDTGYAGKLVFVNDSSGSSTITGLSGSVTVFGGAGGGHYEGGGLGGNLLEGQAGLVTLVGSTAGNDTLIASGKSTVANTFNVLNAGAFDSTGAINSGGNDILMSTSTAGSTFFTTNAGLDQVSAMGSGTQYFQLNPTGIATVTASSHAINQFFLTESSVGGATTDLIKNFSLTRDNFLITNSASGTGAGSTSHNNTITGVQNSQVLGGGNIGSIVTLANGSEIKLVGVSFTKAEITSIHGGYSF